MTNKTAKTLSLSLIIALMFSALIPITLVNAAGIPNPTSITYVTIGGPETVDPHWAYDTASAEVIQNIYEPLLMYGPAGVDPALGYKAMAADWWPGYGVGDNTIVPIKPGYNETYGTGWKQAAETWLFKIRKGMKWQDWATYGNVTPYDVEYSFKRGLLFDHTNGPMWMIYEPLLDKEYSYDYDLDGDGNVNATEYVALRNDIDWAINSNSTHVWFNLPVGYGPFQQVLVMSWSYVMCAQWCKDQGLWKGNIANYTDFKRTWDLPEPGPLMNPAKAMGSGPYTLTAMNEDPNVGWYVLTKFNDYWQGWSPTPHVTQATVKNVAEWANRKAQFFSTDPTLQADLCVVPRSNCPELHIGGNKNGPTLPGIKLIQPALPSQTMDCFAYNFNVTVGSPYMPKVGGVNKPELFSDRNMRLALSYLFNATQYINDVFLGEATQSSTFMPPGTTYYNYTKPKYGLNVTKAQNYLNLVLGGDVIAQGLTLKLAYNIGNTARQTLCTMMAYGLINSITWGPHADLDISAIGVPWATYLPELRAKKLCIFSIGWLADFPDAHNWASPFMSPTGTYCSRQRVKFGLNPTTMNWAPDASYGAPPYTNAKGEWVTAINNTYVAHLISLGVQESNPATRQMIYNELQDIYYADIVQLPTVTALRRHYERSWVNGWGGTYNENPICPGNYFYYMWKGTILPIYGVDMSAVGSITNTTKVYPIIQNYEGEMRVKGKGATINYTLHVTYVGPMEGPTIWVAIYLTRHTINITYYIMTIIVTIGPGEHATINITWYEPETITVEFWTIDLEVSPMGTAGGIVYDTDLTNNQVNSPYKVRVISMPGDIEGNGKIDEDDLWYFCAAFIHYYQAGFADPKCDFDGNEKLDEDDLWFFCAEFLNYYKYPLQYP